MERNDEEEFHEERKEGREKDAESRVGVNEAEEADAEGCRLSEERGYGRSVRGQGVSEVGDDLAVIKGAVESAAEDVDAD